MKNIFPALFLFLTMVSQNAGAVEKVPLKDSAGSQETSITCSQKIASCKALWKKADLERGKDAKVDEINCINCLNECIEAQNSCKMDKRDDLQAANIYHLGCRVMCNGM